MPSMLIIPNTLVKNCLKQFLIKFSIISGGLSYENRCMEKPEVFTGIF
jgi:hypothetical protein